MVSHWSHNYLNKLIYLEKKERNINDWWQRIFLYLLENDVFDWEEGSSGYRRGERGCVSCNWIE